MTAYCMHVPTLKEAGQRLAPYNKATQQAKTLPTTMHVPYLPRSRPLTVC